MRHVVTESMATGIRLGPAIHTVALEQLPDRMRLGRRLSLGGEARSRCLTT